MNRYAIVDFKELVSNWYNEFLPEAEKDKFNYVEWAEILYLNNISPKVHLKESLKFLVRKIEAMSATGEIPIIVQEPKAVNNAKVQPFLKFVEGRGTAVSQVSLNKLLHLANKRYVIISKDVLISQDKEIDEFLDEVFVLLQKLHLQNIRFYASQSLGIQDVIDVARGLFPKSILSVRQFNQTGHIEVKSSSEVMAEISGSLMQKWSDENKRFVEKCHQAMLKDIEQLI